MNTPAVTRVDEWTNAEIGVGAAIAAGNQADKGNCALFEIAATINRKIINIGWNCDLNDQFMEKNKIAIEIKIAISPNRFIIIVIVPEAADEWFW